MSDLLSLLPSFSISSPAASHLLTSLENLSITTADLLTLDALDISRRINSASVLDIKRLVADIIACIHQDIATISAATRKVRPGVIKTRDATIDALLGGGIRTQCITEFVGESGAGKTQILLLLTLTAQLPPHLGGLSRPSIYISTESPLSTRRLLQINATLSSICASAPPPSTDRVFSITCSDLESQEHIIRYQLPVMVEKFNVGLIVIDSVAANFRSEFERPGVKRLKTATSASTSPPAAALPAPPGGQMAMRGYDMVRLAQILRSLAVTHNLAVVVSNQVSDKFSPRPSFSSPDGGDDDPMSLDFQSRWFTGCDGRGDGEGKVPALGLVWANLVATRIVVRKREDPRTGEWRRGIAVVYSPRVQAREESPFEIFEGGVRTVTKVSAPVGGGDTEDQ